MNNGWSLSNPSDECPCKDDVEPTSGIEPEYTVLQFAGCRPKQSSLMSIRLILFGFGVGV
jgi:hypothetical protein